MSADALTAPLMAGDTMPATARHYIDKLGFQVIAIEAKGKQPVGQWQSEHVAVDDLERTFGGNIGHNLAVPLGARSGGLVDVDLDWTAITPFADYLFTTLPSFGRPGKPRSHRLALCPQALELKKCTQVAFKLPASMKGNAQLPGEHALCIAELRGNGQYTIFPPSTHVSGEPITWTDGALSLQEMTWDSMRSKLGLAAVLAAFAQFYPPEGVRNDFSLALGGSLCRYFQVGGMDDDKIPARVDEIVQLVCQYGGDKGQGKSWTQRAAKTLAKMNGGAPVTALKSAVRMAGFPDECYRLFCNWLGVDDLDERPHITFDEHDLSKCLDKIEDALIATGTPIYQQGGRIVLTHRLDKMTQPEGNIIKRPPGAIVTKGVNDMRLFEFMVDKIHFRKQVVNKAGEVVEVRASPPRTLAGHMTARGDMWRMPVLNGVVETPTLRADGSLLTKEGYDMASGLILDTNGVRYPEIPSHPSKDEALAALAILKDPIKDFPFVPDAEDVQLGSASASKSVALSAMLTGLVRRSMRAAPMHGFTAPTMGTGKSLLCDIVSMIATGKTAATMTQGADEEEDEKRLVGALLQGDSMLCIDNIDRLLEGAFLSKILTEQMVQVRVLGSTGQVSGPCSMFIMANGNNLTIARDLTARAVMCRLDARIESPEKRTFDRDLKTWVPANRPALVAAGLTVLRGYICADKPMATLLRNTENFARFEDWSDLVRGALVWLGEPDPVATRQNVVGTDPTRETLASVIAAIRDSAELSAEPFTSKELYTYAHSLPDLKLALESAMPHGITVRACSLRLADWADKIIDGSRIARLPPSRGFTYYRLMSTGEAYGAVEPEPGSRDQGQTSLKSLFG